MALKRKSDEDQLSRRGRSRVNEPEGIARSILDSLSWITGWMPSLKLNSVTATPVAEQDQVPDMVADAQLVALYGGENFVVRYHAMVTAVNPLPPSKNKTTRMNNEEILTYPAPGVTVNGYTFGKQLGKGGYCVVLKAVKGPTTYAARTGFVYENYREEHGFPKMKRVITFSAKQEMEFWKKVMAEAQKSPARRSFVEKLFLCPIEIMCFKSPQDTLMIMSPLAIGDFYNVTLGRSGQHSISLLLSLHDICAGMQFMHETLHVAHCDFKGANALVRVRDGVLRCYVADFDGVRNTVLTPGISHMRVLEGNPHPGEICGTSSFMGPEMCVPPRDRFDIDHHVLLPFLDESDVEREPFVGDKNDCFSVGVTVACAMMVMFPPQKNKYLHTKSNAVRRFLQDLPVWDRFSRPLQNGAEHTFTAIPMLNASIEEFLNPANGPRRTVDLDTVEDLEFIKKQIINLTQFSTKDRQSAKETMKNINDAYGSVDDIVARVSRVQGPAVPTSGLVDAWTPPSQDYIECPAAPHRPKWDLSID